MDSAGELPPFFSHQAHEFASGPMQSDTAALWGMTVDFATRVHAELGDRVLRLSLFGTVAQDAARLDPLDRSDVDVHYSIDWPFGVPLSPIVIGPVDLAMREIAMECGFRVEERYQYYELPPSDDPEYDSRIALDLQPIPLAVTQDPSLITNPRVRQDYERIKEYEVVLYSRDG